VHESDTTFDFDYTVFTLSEVAFQSGDLKFFGSCLNITNACEYGRPRAFMLAVGNDISNINVRN